MNEIMPVAPAEVLRVGLPVILPGPLPGKLEEQLVRHRHREPGDYGISGEVKIVALRALAEIAIAQRRRKPALVALFNPRLAQIETLRQADRVILAVAILAPVVQFFMVIARLIRIEQSCGRLRCAVVMEALDIAQRGRNAVPRQERVVVHRAEVVTVLQTKCQPVVGKVIEEHPPAVGLDVELCQRPVPTVKGRAAHAEQPIPPQRLKVAHIRAQAEPQVVIRRQPDRNRRVIAEEDHVRVIAQAHIEPELELADRLFFLDGHACSELLRQRPCSGALIDIRSQFTDPRELRCRLFELTLFRVDPAAKPGDIGQHAGLGRPLRRGLQGHKSRFIVAGLVFRHAEKEMRLPQSVRVRFADVDEFAQQLAAVLVFILARQCDCRIQFHIEVFGRQFEHFLEGGRRRNVFVLLQLAQAQPIPSRHVGFVPADQFREDALGARVVALSKGHDPPVETNAALRILLGADGR